MRLHHIAINTGDLDRMVNFYSTLFGCCVVKEGGWTSRPEADRTIGLTGSATRQVLLDAGNCFIELFEFSKPAPTGHPPLRPCDRGYTHLCIDVDDLDAEHRRLSDAGMRFIDAPRTFGPIRSAYGYDPDGNIVEVQELTDKSNIMNLDLLGTQAAAIPEKTHHAT